MLRFLQVFCALFSGIITALAIPNELLLLGSPVIGLFAAVPLYIAVSRAKSYRESFWLCGLQALVVHLLSSFWLGNFKDFAIFTLGASAAGTAVIEACAGLFYYFPFSRRSSSQILAENGGRRSFLIPLRIFWFASLYTVYEWVKSTGFLAYPWGTLSMTAFRWPLVTQIAAITGPYGVTFLFALFSAVCGEGVLLLSQLISAVRPQDVFDSWKTAAFACAALFCVTVAYGTYEYALPRKPVKTLNAVLVQQNLDPWAGSDAQAIAISTRLTEEKIREFNQAGIDPDLVVWSEAVLDRPFPNSMNHYRAFPEGEPLVSFISRMNVPFIIGGSLTVNRAEHKYSNAAVLIDKDGNYAGAYAKLHLVPFAEVIPGADYAWVRALLNKLVGFSTGWTPGRQDVLFEIPVKTPPSDECADPVKIVSIDGREEKQYQPSVFVSTPICFDDAFAEVCRGLFLAGSDVFINITNDSWSLTDSAEYQHFVVASYRAIEYRTTLARSTNAGYTVVLDPAGRVLQSAPLFEQHALAARIPVYKRILTTYARFGNWIPAVCLILAALYIIVSSFAGKHSAAEEISLSCIGQTPELDELLLETYDA
jgi:apolipoprotein N-acyltransferase